MNTACAATIPPGPADTLSFWVGRAAAPLNLGWRDCEGRQHVWRPFFMSRIFYYIIDIYMFFYTRIDLRIMSVKGNSMMPTLNNGDIVLVDTGRRAPSPPGIFVLHDGMGLVAKRLEHIPNSDPPRVKIVSDNDRYAPYERLVDEMNIVGRIRWFAGEI
jgi:hypothetical protein